MYYHMRVAGLERDLPICPVNENLSIAGFIIFGDQELTVACARELLKKAPPFGGAEGLTRRAEAVFNPKKQETQEKTKIRVFLDLRLIMPYTKKYVCAQRERT